MFEILVRIICKKQSIKYKNNDAIPKTFAFIK